MFGWFKRFRAPVTEVPVVAVGGGTDWLVVPFELQETCRISMYSIASHPDLTDNLREAIRSWLTNYDAALSAWFLEHYGPDVFKMLEAVSTAVHVRSERNAARQQEERHEQAFNRWEQEFGEAGNE